MIALIVLSVATMMVLATPAQESGRADDSPLKRPVEFFESNDEPALDAILRFGRENSIPVGLIVTEQLCSSRTATLRVDHAPAEAVIAMFAQALPQYGWAVEEGAVVFAPNDMPEPVAKLLAVVPPPYRIAEDTLQGQLAWAWMDIRAALRPWEGTGFSVLSSPNSVRWPALAVRGITVRQLLSRLVARNKGGAWLLLPFADFDKIADDRPIWVLDYAETPNIERIRSVCAGGKSGQFTSPPLPPPGIRALREAVR
jgi:hypothetical protein